MTGLFLRMKEEEMSLRELFPERHLRLLIFISIATGAILGLLVPDSITEMHEILKTNTGSTKLVLGTD